MAQRSGTFATSLPRDFIEYLLIASIPINCHDECLGMDSSHFGLMTNKMIFIVLGSFHFHRNAIL